MCKGAPKTNEYFTVSENVVREKPYGMEFDHTLRFAYFVFENFENKTLNAQHAKMFPLLYIALEHTSVSYPLFSKFRLHGKRASSVRYCRNDT